MTGTVKSKRKKQAGCNLPNDLPPQADQVETKSQSQFDVHIEELRMSAAADKIHFADKLEEYIINIGCKIAPLDAKLKSDDRVPLLIDQLRPLYSDLVIEGLTNHVRDINNDRRAAKAIANRQKQNLDGGRPMGAKAQKEHAAETWRIVAEKNNALLSQVETSRMWLVDRATNIRDSLIAEKRFQPNGQPYALSTIRGRIAGKGKE